MACSLHGTRDDLSESRFKANPIEQGIPEVGVFFSIGEGGIHFGLFWGWFRLLLKGPGGGGGVFGALASPGQPPHPDHIRKFFLQHK